jgi:DNA-binding beta-propeller fold protein YncE
MRNVRSTSVRWTAVLVTALAVLVACDSSEPSGPTGEAASELRKGGGKGLGQSAFFVGNFSPGGTTNGILRYDGRGAFIDRMVPEGSGGLTIGCCMAFGPDENLYVGSPVTGNVLRYNGVTGEFIDEFIPSGSGGLVVPLVLLFRNGLLYVGDLGTRSIRRYDALTGNPIAGGTFIETAEQGTGEGDPQLFEFGPDGNVYVASAATSRVLRYHGRTGAFIDEFVPAGPNGVVAPSGLTFGPDGELYVGSTARNEVRRYDFPTARLIDVFVQPGSGGLTVPVGIIFGPDGNLYVASSESGDVLGYNGRTGKFIDEFVPAGRGGITGPRVIAFKSTITVCHRPPGNPRRGKTLTIGYLVGRKHVVGHGDTIGRCAGT